MYNISRMSSESGQDSRPRAGQVKQTRSSLSSRVSCSQLLIARCVLGENTRVRQEPRRSDEGLID